MSDPRRQVAKPLVRLALALQVLLLVAGVVGYLQGSNYIELNLRRSVEHSAAVAVNHWQRTLELIYQQGREVPQEPKAAHLMPVPSLDAASLVKEATPPVKEMRPLPGVGEGFWVWWPGDFGQGLSGLSVVKAQEGCRQCHPQFVPGEVVGGLSFRVETPFLSRILYARKLSLITLIGSLLLLTSAAVWLMTGVVLKRERQAEKEREEAERQLAASEERYRTLVESNLVGVYLLRGDRVLFCNERAAEMFGYTREEVLEKVKVPDLVAPEDRATVLENIRKRLSGEVKALRYSFTGVRADGSRFPAEVFGARVDLPSGPAVLGIILDDSEPQAARQVVEAAYRAVVALPGENVFQAAAELVAALLHVPVVFVAEEIDGQLSLLGAHGAVQKELIPLAGTPCEVAIREKRPLELASGFAAQFGTPGWIQVVPECYFGMPLVGSAGQALGILAVLDSKPRQLSVLERQILEIYAVRLGRELERLHLLRQQKELEGRLAAHEKLAALGVLAGGIAHDFNNVLAGIVAEAEVLRRLVPPEAHEKVEQLVSLAQRGGEVVRRILSFARPSVTKPEPISVAELVQDTVELAHHTFGPQFHFDLQLEGELFVLGEEALLQQALLNLLTNARDAMPAGGSVAIRVYPRNGEVVLEVEDHGTGIDPVHLPRVFDPFFTTKPRGHGTGLGLTTVYRTVEAHGGTVAIDSKLGVGTKVTLTLPRIPPPQTTKPSAAPSTLKASRPAGCGVLLVDDEPAILEGLRQVLELEGYRVVCAKSAEEALRSFQPSEIHVAVVDVLLPGVNGIQLAQHLLEKKPDLAVVFSSGHTPEALPPGLVSRDSVVFLQKPYTARVLLETVERLCSRA
ncbi:Sensor kinase CckA [bacterium HR09]|nr:Sensor kinase CckA [bacterium HR09]